MISALFIYDSKGDVLISKLYKEGIRRNISDAFRIQVINGSSGNGCRGKDIQSPVLTLGSTSFIHIKSGILWICAITRSNQDCSAILEFLYKLQTLLKVVLLGGSDGNITGKELTDENIKNNFIVINELLDEIIEFGYPTNLELAHLKNCMTSIQSNDKMFKYATNALKSNNVNLVANDRNNNNIADVTWRSSGIKYRRNEIFLNVEEKLTVLMNSEAKVLRAHVDGTIQMKAHLSGMPECTFGLNDESSFINSNRSKTGTESVALEDSKFHQCVQLNKFDQNRIIQFIPPDGEFQLMSYHCMSNLILPFKVYSQVQESGRSKVVYKLTVRSLFPSKIAATSFRVKIPTPKGVLKSNASSSLGKSKYHPEEDSIIWKCNKFFGEQEHVLTAEVQLVNNNSDQTNNILNWSRPPINLEFIIDMFSCSGLTVKYLKVMEESNYRTVKWVKYTSKAGSFDVRY